MSERMEGQISNEQNIDFELETLNYSPSQLKLWNSPQQFYPYEECNTFSSSMVSCQDTIGKDFNSEFDEPPLMEELGIDPSGIFNNIICILNPFTNSFTAEKTETFINTVDLAGPLAFCLILGFFLLISGGKAQFGYLYSLAMVSCFMMYILLNLMSITDSISLAIVASILGYSLFPVVCLSAASVIISLQTKIGMILSIIAVGWCSLCASRIFVTLTMDQNQRPLLVYPCMLLYGAFAIIAVF